jgi:hypothetical protein
MVWCKADPRDAHDFIDKFGTESLKFRLHTAHATPPPTQSSPLLVIAAGVPAIIVQFALGTPVITLITEKKGFSWPGAGTVIIGITVLVRCKRKPANIREHPSDERI